MPKSLETRNFSILNMKDDYEEASELLLKAMLNQNPEIDADNFDIRLRELISRFGNGNLYNNSAFAALASEDTNSASVYNSAGDFLAIAFASYHDGDKQQAMDMFETAMEEADARTLFEAILINNKRSPIGIEADESDENDKPEKTKDMSSKDIDESDEDNNEIINLPDDDDDNSDNLTSDRTTDNEINITKASLNDFVKSLSEESNESLNEPISAALLKAAGNKLSLRGSNESKQQARNLKANVR